ncbi:hypothetical protein P3339_11615 [Microbulbifer sp. MLAF003]|uniref:hypothetical protein n=1 Tax=Microbulbifer sp. MLAF003 TaxID=3032582 RepID=UPI0024AE3B2B|nr:hypothetical protein [Microbulbifer sp. MLAF003]WHI53362.1 hypothetical protein P3339_11615 [Microbulbifer sp. MLAF003]
MRSYLISAFCLLLTLPLYLSADDGKKYRLMEEINSDQVDFKDSQKNRKSIVKRGRFNGELRKIVTGDELEVLIDGKLSQFKTKNVNRKKIESLLLHLVRGKGIL